MQIRMNILNQKRQSQLMAVSLYDGPPKFLFAMIHYIDFLGMVPCNFKSARDYPLMNASPITIYGLKA